MGPPGFTKACFRVSYQSSSSPETFALRFGPDTPNQVTRLVKVPDLQISSSQDPVLFLQHLRQGSEQVAIGSQVQEMASTASDMDNHQHSDKSARPLTRFDDDSTFAPGCWMCTR